MIYYGTGRNEHSSASVLCITLCYRSFETGQGKVSEHRKADKARQTNDKCTTAVEEMCRCGVGAWSHVFVRERVADRWDCRLLCALCKRAPGGAGAVRQCNHATAVLAFYRDTSGINKLGTHGRQAVDAAGTAVNI